MARVLFGWIAGAVALLAAAGNAFALCAPIAEGPGARVFRTAVIPEGVPPRGSVEVTYIGHSTFLIRTAEGVTAATDYNDYYRAPIVPTITPSTTTISGSSRLTSEATATSTSSS